MDEILRKLADNQESLTALLKEQKVAANVHQATPLHGLGGIWSGAGVERDVITAMIRPSGLGAVLKKFPTVFQDPRFSALTGYTAPTGTQPTNACDDAPQAYVKSCELTALFGLKRFDTQTIEMDSVMLRANRGDHRDLMLRGEVLGMSGFTPSGLNQQQILEVVTMSEMVNVGVQMERALAVDLWQGTVAGGTFPGLDAQIVTGQVDARNNVACPALDSDVKDFNYNDVCGTTLDIVEYMSMMEFYLRFNAQRMGLMPVTWVVVMRPELWFELSACWPCSYLSNRCNTAAGANIAVINDNVNTGLRDDMRNNNFIDINGNRLMVITDDGIAEQTNIDDGNVPAGSYASSIYFVPLTIQGTFPVTYMEYLDYRQAGVDRSLLRGMEDWFWTDNGMYSWAIEQQKWCYKLALKVEPRCVLRTPQLAGKIDNVLSSPLQHLRSFDTDSAYHHDGGTSLAPTGTRYAIWDGAGMEGV